MQARALRIALNSAGKYKYKAPDSEVDFLVVGGGVVGLAVAQRLSARFLSASTYLVERHQIAGQEISSRNSEVVHAGLYYPPDSLKTQLCLRGRQLLYERCDRHNVPYQKTGKLVVATERQRPYIENLHAKAQSLHWPRRSTQHPHSSSVLPTTLMTGAEARQLEPDLSMDIAAALWSPETGIVDSHSLMKSLEKDIIESEGGELVYSTQVVRVDPYRASSPLTGSTESRQGGWVVQVVTENAEEGDAILAKTLINASGLSAPFIINSLLPEESRIPMYYARGSYASYSGPGISNVSHLIYPCPEVGENAAGFESLGTHLTIDLQGKVRFGPDIQWISPPSASGSAENDRDFWASHLVPDDSRLPEMHQAVTQYLSEVSIQGLQPDYVGIRPKLIPPGGGFQDFLFRTDYSSDFGGDGKDGKMISLLGIESPGLTASLAIAETVVEDMLAADGKE